MRCSDIEELLSAYANDELSRTQREFVEAHIADCPDCRMKLEDFIDVRRNLASLREMPVLQDMETSIMSKIQDINIRRTKRKWLRPALISIPVVVILAVLMTLQPWNSLSGTQSVITKAQAAIESLQSYRIVLTSNTDGGISSVEIEFIAPDRYHYKQTGAEFNMEFIIIGDERYFKEVPQTSFELTTMFKSNGYSSLMTREYTLMILDYLIDVQKLPDETMDGTVCLHYKGTYDYEKQLRTIFESNSERGIPPMSEERIKEEIEERRAEFGTTTIELWIGKDDFLLRKIIHYSQRPDNNEGMRSSTITFRFYDFNQPFTIEAPVDSEGNLLSGWVTTSPEYPHFDMDIQAEVDNYDPSNRKVNFTVEITNISTETLTDVDVKIISVFPSTDKNPESKIWFSWDNGQWTEGPYTSDPGESLKYSCTFGYDATSVQPEIVAEMISKSFVGVNYTQDDGQQKSEMFYFETPESIYTLSTDVPPYLVPIDLSVSGEYRIEEQGATYTGNGISGEINGREYLFIEVNTSSAETPASPGILVLDIQDKASPRKVAYLSTNDDTRYIRALAMIGTVLYVSADDFLWVINVSDPSAPQELSRLPGLDTNQMIVSGKYAFISEGHYDIVTLDLSNPAQPEKIGTLPLSSTTNIQMDIFGDYLIAEANDVLNIIDISSPSSLEIISDYSFRAPLDEETPEIIYPWHIMGTEIVGKYAYVTTSTEGKIAIGVLDLSDPVSPSEIAFFHLKDRQYHGPLFASGERIYIFTIQSPYPDPYRDRRTRLEIIDISNPAKPVEKGFVILPDSWSFFSDYYSGSHQSFRLIDNHLYWFLGNSPNKPVIEIFDLSGM